MKTQAKPRRCRFPDCHKTAKPGGLCISHGGGRKCSVDGCTTSMVSRGFCVAHGGGKRCQSEGCPKSAQGGGFCWVHGGGKQCGFEGCTKRAQSGGVCISHGGGKRCRISGCSKVVQIDGLCVAHGGYRTCLLSDECDAKALANGYCIEHGGRTKCLATKCQKKAVSGDFCREHGVGISILERTPPPLVETTRASEHPRDTDAAPLRPAQPFTPMETLGADVVMLERRSERTSTAANWKPKRLEHLEAGGLEDELEANEAREAMHQDMKLLAFSGAEYRQRHRTSWPYNAVSTSTSRGDEIAQREGRWRRCAVVVCARQAKIDGLCLIHGRLRQEQTDADTNVATLDHGLRSLTTQPR